MKKKNLYETITKIFAIVIVMVLCFTACTRDYDFADEHIKTDTIPGPNPPKPEDKVISVTQYDCKSTGISWKSSENVTLTKGYTDEEQEGWALAVVKKNYTAAIEYSVSKPKYPSLSYDNSVYARIYGISAAMYFGVSDDLTTKPSVSEPSEISDGKVYFLDFGAGRKIAIKHSSITSVEYLSFEGVRKTDLCVSEFDKPEVVSISKTDITSDKEGYSKSRLTIKVRETLLNGGNEDITRVMTFAIENVYQKKSGGDPIIPPVDPDVVGYAVRDNEFNGGATTGRVVTIMSDGSEKDFGTFNIKLNHKSETPADVTLKVNDLTWRSNDPTLVELASTGTSRSVKAAGCDIDIQEVYTSLTNRTTKSAMTFKGIYELPTINFPDGTSEKLAYGKYNMKDLNVSESNVTETSKTLTHKVRADFESESESLSANVFLTKDGSGPVEPGEDKESGIVIENFQAGNTYYTMDIVHYWTNKEPTRENNVAVRHSGSQTAQEEMLTLSRNYATTTPLMNSIGSSDYSEDKFTGKVGTFESNFVFAGANVKVTSKYLSTFTYTSQAGNTAKMDVQGQAYKSGSSLGTQDFGDATKYIYKDKVNFGLRIVTADIASCEQILRFEETKNNPGPDPEPNPSDIFARIIRDYLTEISGTINGVIEIRIKNSLGVERDSTIYAPYTTAAVTYSPIADVIKTDKDISFRGFVNIGSSSSANNKADNKDYTTTTQNMNAEYDGFKQTVKVVNQSATVVVAGQTLAIPGTSFAVTSKGNSQAPNSYGEGNYNVWDSHVSYNHGFSYKEFVTSKDVTTDFRIKVEKPIEPIIIPNIGNISNYCISALVPQNYVVSEKSLVLVGTTGCISYRDGYSTKDKNTFFVINDATKQQFMYADGITAPTGPASLFDVNSTWMLSELYSLSGWNGNLTAGWVNTNLQTGEKELIGDIDNMIGGLPNPMIAQGAVEFNSVTGTYKVPNGSSFLYFKLAQ